MKVHFSIDLSVLRVHDCSPWGSKRRLGAPNDGGYVVVDAPSDRYDLLLSCGVGDDTSFERAFRELHPDTPIVLFDGTVEGPPEPAIPGSTFVRKNIDGNYNLADYIDSHRDIFLKMDIEGYEFPWIDSLTDDQLSHFRQIVIEFHHPLFQQGAIDAMTRLLRAHHCLVHLHPNSSCDHFDITIPERGSEGNGGVTRSFKIPYVFECTLMRKKEGGPSPEISKDPIPHPTLDAPNKAGTEDLILTGWPYCESRETAEG